MLYFTDADHLLSTVWNFIHHLFSLLQLTNTTSRTLYFSKHFDSYFFICHVELCNPLQFLTTLLYN